MAGAWYLSLGIVKICTKPRVRGGCGCGNSEMSQDWERYGRTLVASMAEVLKDIDLESHPVVLETADYWLVLGLTIGLEKPEEAARLLELIEAHEENRVELARDAREFSESVLT